MQTPSSVPVVILRVMAGSTLLGGLLGGGYGSLLAFGYGLVVGGVIGAWFGAWGGFLNLVPVVLLRRHIVRHRPSHDRCRRLVRLVTVPTTIVAVGGLTAMLEIPTSLADAALLIVVPTMVAASAAFVAGPPLSGLCRAPVDRRAVDLAERD